MPIFGVASDIDGFNSTAQLTTENANKDGTGAVVDLKSAGAVRGSVITGIELMALVTTSLGMVRIYVHNGTNYRMIDEIPVPVQVVSASAKGWRYVWTPPNSSGIEKLPVGYKIAVSSEKSEAINVVCKGYDL